MVRPLNMLWYLASRSIFNLIEGVEIFMKEFTELPNRKGTRSVKWDLVEEMFGSGDVQPLWVADMDLETADPIKEALKKRIDHGVFGYTVTDNTIDNSVQKWLLKRHGWEIDTDWLIYSQGVLHFIHMAILSQTEPGDNVLIQTPVYPPFHSIIKGHGRKLVTNPLIYEHGKYRIDFDDLELKFQEGTKAMLLCNPHNPVGRVWSKEELTQILQLAEKYNVLIISDDIHSDIVYDDHVHTPIAKIDSPISDRIISCYSPSKTFNIAGIQIAYAVIPDPIIRNEIAASFEKYGLTSINTLGITALEAAYENGVKWLDQLMDLLTVNRKLVEDTFSNRAEINVTHSEATYLIWLDCRKMNKTHEELVAFMENEAKVGLNSGLSFGENGAGFMRLNIASPTSYIKEALDQ